MFFSSSPVAATAANSGPKWGPAFWTFFHTLAEKIDDPQFRAAGHLRHEVFQLIRKICAHLPCPECRAHAAQHMAATQWQAIATKQDLRLYLYFFHEKVTQRKAAPGVAQSFPLHLLEATYRPLPLSQVTARFCQEMAHRVPDMSFAHENAQRGRVAAEVHAWVQEFGFLFLVD